jgi:predicted TIM-barrel fold metal-dependent hydrolase
VRLKVDVIVTVASALPSHLPICKLACSVQQLYAAYLEGIADFSASEKRQMLHDTAAEMYGL